MFRIEGRAFGIVRCAKNQRRMAETLRLVRHSPRETVETGVRLTTRGPATAGRDHLRLRPGFHEAEAAGVHFMTPSQLRTSCRAYWSEASSTLLRVTKKRKYAACSAAIVRTATISVCVVSLIPEDDLVRLYRDMRLSIVDQLQSILPPVDLELVRMAERSHRLSH